MKGLTRAEKDQKVLEMFRLYIENRWNYTQAAKFLGVVPCFAHQILSGWNYKHLPRPEGLVFPWPEHTSAAINHFLTDEEILEAYGKYVKNKWTVGDFARYLGVHFSNASRIIQGTTHKGLLPSNVTYKSRYKSGDGSRRLSSSERSARALK